MNVPVFMYHDLAEGGADVPAGHRPYVLPADHFREHLGSLAALGLPAERLDACLSGTNHAADHARCVITFDDGHLSNLTVAVPLLIEAGFRATFFITAGWMGKAPYLSWPQVRTLADAGMEIGSHSMTHRPPASLTLEELHREMNDSRRLIEDRIGRPVRTASAPTGFFHSALPQVTRDCGYQALCYSRIGLWRPDADPFQIPRVPVKQGIETATFRRLAVGDLDLVRQLRRRQALRGAFKRILGVRGYLGVRRLLLGRRPKP